MKKIIATLTAISLCLSLLASCSKDAVETATVTKATTTATDTTTTTTTSKTTTTETETETETEEVSLETEEDEWFYEDDDYYESQIRLTYQPPKNKSDEYKKMEKEINSIIKKYNYKGEEKQLIIDTFNALYNNYPTWKVGYRNLPSTKEYISKNYINILKDVEVVYYDEKSKEGKKLLDDGMPSGWMEMDEKEKKKSLCDFEKSKR